MQSDQEPTNYRPPTSAAEVLQRYQAGERCFRNLDLPEGSSFRAADLSDADFKNSWLSGVDFRESNLQRVCLEESNLKLSDFTCADLRGASMCGSTLCGAQLSGANVEGVRFEDATYYGAVIDDIRKLVTE